MPASELFIRATWGAPGEHYGIRLFIVRKIRENTLSLILTYVITREAGVGRGRVGLVPSWHVGARGEHDDTTREKPF